MSKLSELLKRIEAAEGPDRELDYEIWAALHGWKIKHNGMARFFQTPDGHDSVRALRAPKLTSSLDAAIALLERMLPGWHYEMACKMTRPFPHYTTMLTNQWASYAAPRFTGQSESNQALALLSALLSALIAKEGISR
ncbi:hypothetical protein AA309_19950 [Microvirga vignae]|uniref:Uncharacterized protein n=1 Tax=Microvirga vignae TaxID=1225564 RepID=A0A0H1RFL4_9HYPH|nr:hypothetical protein [Microvirga vignae]KLK91377.1 hypothetical protein AA309_19950 [Microvirga vignae]